VKDDLGLPVIRITFDIYENERLMYAFMQDKAEELLQEMGAGMDGVRGSYPTAAVKPGSKQRYRCCGEIQLKSAYSNTLHLRSY